MTVFNIHQNKSICVLPWVHKHIDLDKNLRPCCHGRPISQGRTINDVRQEMLDNKFPRECSKCYDEENKKESSARMRETVDWLKKFGQPDIGNPSIQYLDIRNDPTCNLKCKTCGPHSSTLWAKEKGVNVIFHSHDLDQYNKTELKKIYLAGGEPTYNKSYELFLNDLLKVNPDCEVMINTNLKNLPLPWQNIIKSFKNLTVVISCDAIEELGCYIRYPLQWGKFEQNIRFVNTFSNFIMFNLVPSNLTVHKLDQTVEWMSNYTNNISLSIVGGDHWEHRAVPMAFRGPYIEALTKLKDFPIGPWFAHKFRLNLNSLIEKYQSENYDPVLHKKLRDEIAEQDSHRTTQLKDVDPFLHSWIFN